MGPFEEFFPLWYEYLKKNKFQVENVQLIL